MNAVLNNIMLQVTGLACEPKGAFNIRLNGKTKERNSTKNIEIRNKQDGTGIEIEVKPWTKGEQVYLPVVIDTGGLVDHVCNDYYIGKNADVEIISGCGIHNDSKHITQHDGIHTFYLQENAKVRYVEKHYGEGVGSGNKLLNPLTIIHLEKGSRMEIESVQIEGVDSTKRVTKAEVAEDASLIIKEIIMTSGTQTATTHFEVDLNGRKSSATVSSRSVAKGKSKQYFYSVINGNNLCTGHSECDAILMDNAMVKAVPDVTANHVDASLIHEAAIGKIAGEQIVKLTTLGMSPEEAEEKIILGFLR